MDFKKKLKKMLYLKKKKKQIMCFFNVKLCESLKMFEEKKKKKEQ